MSSSFVGGAGNPFERIRTGVLDTGQLLAVLRHVKPDCRGHDTQIQPPPKKLSTFSRSRGINRKKMKFIQSRILKFCILYQAQIPNECKTAS